MSRIALAAAVLSWGFTLAACDTPRYVDESQGEKSVQGLPGQVVFDVHASYTQNPPTCVAILPFEVPPGNQSQIDLRIDQAGTVRRAIYAHLAPQGKRDI